MTTSHDVQVKLRQLGIELPAAGTPAAAYVMAAQTDSQAFLSGHIARKDGKPWAGKLGADMTTEQGKTAACAIAVDLITTLNTHLGDDLSRVKRIVRMMSLVNSTQEFAEQHLMTDDVSGLFVEVFGDAGKHAHSAFGVAQIPFGACIKIELIAEITWATLFPAMSPVAGQYQTGRLPATPTILPTHGAHSRGGRCNIRITP